MLAALLERRVSHRHNLRVYLLSGKSFRFQMYYASAAVSIFSALMFGRSCWQFTKVTKRLTLLTKQSKWTLKENYNIMYFYHTRSQAMKNNSENAQDKCYNGTNGSAAQTLQQSFKPLSQAIIRRCVLIHPTSSLIIIHLREKKLELRSFTVNPGVRQQALELNKT